MKAFILKEEDATELLESLELTKLRESNFLGAHDPKKQEIQDIHRTFHFIVTQWLQQHGFNAVRR